MLHQPDEYLISRSGQAKAKRKRQLEEKVYLWHIKRRDDGLGDSYTVRLGELFGEVCRIILQFAKREARSSTFLPGADRGLPPGC